MAGRRRPQPLAHAGPDVERLTWGRHPVREALRGRRRVTQVLATDAASSEVRSALGSVDVREATIAELDTLTGGAVHQGIVAHVDPFPYVGEDELFAAPGPGGGAPLVVCLDQVTDPQNLGAIARVVDASGASGILVPRHRSAHVTAAVCKASAGAVEHVRVARCTNVADTILRMKSDAMWAYGASERGSTVYTDVDFSGPTIIVLGSEGAGIRPRVEAACDDLVRIPMAGSVSSLNVATVGALLAFEVVRQRGAR